MSEEGGGFLSRWARRKEQARAGVEVAPEPPTDAALVGAETPIEPVPPQAPAPTVGDAAAAAQPLPTMADVAMLSHESDYSRFVASGVDEGVKRAAMRKLFSDPHFNVMDGLDTYIDDYGKPDPIPIAMLRQMNQSKILRLFEVEEQAEEAKQIGALENPAPIDETVTPTDDDPDLRLQQDDAAGRPGPGEGTGA